MRDVIVTHDTDLTGRAGHQAAIESRRSAEKVSRRMADLRKENEQLRTDRGRNLLRGVYEK